MFNKDSVIVGVWVKAVRDGVKTIDEVPNLSNLIDVVTQIVEGGQ